MQVVSGNKLNIPESFKRLSGMFYIGALRRKNTPGFTGKENEKREKERASTKQALKSCKKTKPPSSIGNGYPID